MIYFDMALREDEFNRALPEAPGYRVLCWLRLV